MTARQIAEEFNNDRCSIVFRTEEDFDTLAAALAPYLYECDFSPTYRQTGNFLKNWFVETRDVIGIPHNFPIEFARCGRVKGGGFTKDVNRPYLTKYTAADLTYVTDCDFEELL